MTVGIIVQAAPPSPPRGVQARVVLNLGHSGWRHQRLVFAVVPATDKRRVYHYYGGGSEQYNGFQGRVDFLQGRQQGGDRKRLRDGVEVEPELLQDRVGAQRLLDLVGQIILVVAVVVAILPSQLILRQAEVLQGPGLQEQQKRPVVREIVVGKVEAAQVGMISDRLRDDLNIGQDCRHCCGRIPIVAGPQPQFGPLRIGTQGSGQCVLIRVRRKDSKADQVDPFQGSVGLQGAAELVCEPGAGVIVVVVCEMLGGGGGDAAPPQPQGQFFQRRCTIGRGQCLKNGGRPRTFQLTQMQRVQTTPSVWLLAHYLCDKLGFERRHRDIGQC